jgi:hypothetical protein
MNESDIKIGGVYSVARVNGTFGVIKILAYQPEIDCIYACTYGAYFNVRTKSDDIGQNDRQPEVMLKALGWGIGALPITKRVFEYWQPEYMFTQEISETDKSNLSECYGHAQPWDDLKYP